MSTDAAFQARSVKQGSDFEWLVALHLQFKGWNVTEMQATRHGTTIDIVAYDPGDVEHWIECKGADGASKRRPGLRDGTTVKVAIGVAYYLQSCGHHQPYVIATSHLPVPGGLPDTMINRCVADGAIYDVWGI